MMVEAFVRQPLFKWLADGFKFKFFSANYTYDSGTVKAPTLKWMM